MSWASNYTPRPLCKCPQCSVARIVQQGTTWSRVKDAVGVVWYGDVSKYTATELGDGPILEEPDDGWPVKD